MPGAAGVHVYTLGPPRDEDLLRKLDVSGGEAGFGLATQVSLLGAVEHLVSNPGEPAPGPCDARYRLTREEALASPFFREYYGSPDDPLGDHGESWRRIDDEWLVSGIGQLALQIDKKTNNTSFAVAFELPDGRTLFFPGDAQFGNWLSWDALAFTDEAGKPVPMTTKQLLNHAVFYKVGHHGSHNATRELSLHEMTSGALVAMIPTDEAFALEQNPKGTWQMPDPELATDLGTRTGGRILRADKPAPEPTPPAGATTGAADWAAFRARVTTAAKPLLADGDLANPLYIEYRLPPDERS